MNIFHKLDIHYPGTDIRAAARGSGRGKGPLSPPAPTPLQPGARGLDGAAMGWGYPAPPPSCRELISPDLGATGPTCQPAGVCREGRAPGTGSGPRRCRPGGETGGERAGDPPFNRKFW